MNTFLLTVVITEVCLGICLWCSPQFMRWLGAHLLARADVIDATRDEGERRLNFWRDELGLTAQAPTDARVQPVRQAS